MVWALLLVGIATDVALLAALFALLVLFSALFSATEASLLSLPAYHRRRLGEAGEAGGAMDRLLARPNRLLVTVLVGNYLVNVSAAGVAVVLAIRAAGGTTVLAVLAGLVLAALALLTLGEFVPRALATLDPDATSRAVAPFILATGVVLAPLVWAFEHASAALFRILGAPMTRRVFLDEEELKHMIEVGREQGILEQEEEEMLSAVIDFGDTTAAEVMVPRTDMVTVTADFRVVDAMEVVILNGYSRIPACGQGIDDIVGIVHAKDLMRAERDGHEDRLVVGLARPAKFVPETKGVADLLREMQVERFHMAIVIDEYGGTAGLVTLEDIIEELLGEIVDEFDVEDPMIEPLPGGDVRVNARMALDEVNDLIHAQLPEGDWDTIGGLLLSELGHVPTEGECVEVDGWRLTAQRVQGRRIGRVRLHRIEAFEPS